MAPSGETLAKGEVLGRYVLGELRGRGAMGAVYAAFDPELRRRVAIKVIGGTLARRGIEAARERLRREAQALARLAHPNVVRVFDVGASNERLFLAMELVEGRDLRRWLAERPRRWDEVVEVMEQVGRGVAAAHALGIVHRDLKPENVLVADDGRVKVGDFGLARRLDDDDEVEDDEVPITAASGVSPSLTMTGTAIGTPLYMAPEQHEGREAEPRSDQYALCVTLFEALYGRRPFDSAGDEGALAEAKRRGMDSELEPRGAAGRVPRRLRALLRRGLAPRPDDRYSSMEPLLDELARVRARSSTVRAAVAVGGLLVLAGAGVLATTQDAERSPCVEAGRLGEAWSEAAREQVRSRLGEHRPADAVARTMAGLDRWTSAWAQQRREACEATWERGEQSPARLDARTACSGAQWAELEATVALLGEADEATARRADELVQGLPRVARCERGESRATIVMEDEAAAGAVRETLARVAALRRAARYDEAWAVLSELPVPSEPSAEAAEVAVVRGQLLDDRGRLEEGERQYEHALRLARAAGDAGSEADAWLSLAHMASQLRHDPDRARFLAQMGMAAARSQGGDDRIDAWAHSLMGSLAFVEGDDEQAREHWERALELRRELLGEEHPITATSLNDLGGALYGQGDLDGAERALRGALEIRERLFGPDHPAVADSSANFGLIFVARGDAAEAVRWNRRALEILLRHLGPDHPQMVRAHDGLGQALYDDGQVGEAREHFERARVLAEQTLPPGHPMTASILLSLARVDLERGELSAAEGFVVAAVAVAADDSLDPQMRAEVHWLHARVLEALERRDEAQRAAREALAHAIETGDDAFDLRLEIEAWLGVVRTPSAG